MTGRPEKRCPRCGAAFPCGAHADAPCWCAALPPIAAIDPAIDCLCPSCLASPLPTSAPTSAPTRPDPA